MKKDVTIVVLAYNEEDNITPAIRSLITAMKGYKDGYEILLIDDGSRDKTHEIVDRLTKENPSIRVIHHKKNMGFGTSFREGVQKARKTYITGFPGDNDTSAVSFRRLIDAIGKVDVITAYSVGGHTRPLIRRFISSSYVIFMNILFGMKLRYFNGSFICKTEILQKTPLVCDGMAIYAESKVRLIKKGYSYMELPFEHIGRKHGGSKAISWKNITSTAKTVLALIRDVYFSS